MTQAECVVWTDADTNETRYNWDAIAAAAQTAGIEPNDLKDWVFDGVTDTLTADELLAAYKAESEETPFEVGDSGERIGISKAGDGNSK